MKNFLTTTLAFLTLAGGMALIIGILLAQILVPLAIVYVVIHFIFKFW